MSVLKRNTVLVSLLLALVPFTRALASDWEEDKPAPKAVPGHGQNTVILDDSQADHIIMPKEDGGQGASRPILQGSATAVHTRPAQTSSSLAAATAARSMEVQRLEADARFFLQKAVVNQIVQPAVFKAFVETNNPGFLLSAENNSDSILLIHGQWDDSDKPLHSLGLKYKAIKTKEMSEFPFDKAKVLIIDCAGEIPRISFQKVRDFVARGGYLLTTDWGLQNVLEQCFPGYVQWNRDNTEGVITDAFIVEPDSGLLRGLNGRMFTWKLDKLSQCVRILRQDKVHLIARSAHLSRQDPQLRVLPDPMLAGALAVEFSFGRGKVLHLVGHFDNCSNSFKPQMLPDPTPGGGISLRQVLATNFIIEALTKKADAANQEPPQE